MSFLGSLFGSDQKKDLRRAKAASDAELDAGYQGGNAYYDQAYDELSPYAERGNEANEAYSNALLGTPEQRAALFSSYANDPASQGVLGLQSNAMLRRLNA